ncbi:unnamed protein product [Trichogramma brassicae]|uniref:Reverse transcriptase domain-containing protein n=1 Tax=Trichogramma brassicae TaxID=86971 RepID=A0A6H5IS82_9HYME|nr:unnamed protein product [Trichogramma brassicae]
MDCISYPNCPRSNAVHEKIERKHAYTLRYESSHMKQRRESKICFENERSSSVRVERDILGDVYVGLTSATRVVRSLRHPSEEFECWYESTRVHEREPVDPTSEKTTRTTKGGSGPGEDLDIVCVDKISKQHTLQHSPLSPCTCEKSVLSDFQEVVIKYDSDNNCNILPPTPARRPRPSDRQHSNIISTSSSAASAPVAQQHQHHQHSSSRAITAQPLASIEISSAEVAYETCDQRIISLIKEFQDIFHIKGEKLTTMHDVEHAIYTKDDVPVNAKPYRFPQPLREELERQLTEMLKSGIIEESKSLYRSNIFLVPKAPDSKGNKKYRLVVDYRQLNEKTEPARYPLPNILDIIDHVAHLRTTS